MVSAGDASASGLLVGYMDITAINEPSEYEKAYEKVSQYRKEKTQQLKGESDKKRCVASGLLLNSMLRRWDIVKKASVNVEDTNVGAINIEPANVEHANIKPVNIEPVKLDILEAADMYDSKYDYRVGITANGKPYFEDRPQLYYNISHAGKYVVCVVGDCPVGIDIEGNRTIKENIAKRFFSQHECLWIEEEADSRESGFFRLWTLKEAYAKLTGEGIALSMSTAHFHMGRKPQLVDEKGDIRQDVMFYEYTLSEDYYIALAKYVNIS